MTREECIQAVNIRLEKLIGCADTYPELRDAMRYSLQAGGKRIRPVLHILSNAAFGGSLEACLDMACAIEMVHTYSLIHDDLPAMDNDNLRRGVPTNHVMFGEAMAILAGDALLSFAFETMLARALSAGEQARYLRAVQVIAEGSGAQGMVAGQAADISLEGQDISSEQLEYIHARKTGALITASVVSGAELAGADDSDLRKIRAYGDDIGAAFQIIDDILDVEGSAHTLGKHPGKDIGAGKCTFVSLYGIEEARRIAGERTTRAADVIRSVGPRAEPLATLAEDILKRDR